MCTRVVFVLPKRGEGWGGGFFDDWGSISLFFVFSLFLESDYISTISFLFLFLFFSFFSVLCSIYIISSISITDTEPPRFWYFTFFSISGYGI